MNEDILRNLNYRIDRTLDSTRQMIEDDEIEERIDEYKKKAENYIVDNPIKCIAGGLLAGFVIGKIFSDD